MCKLKSLIAVGMITLLSNSVSADSPNDATATFAIETRFSGGSATVIKLDSSSASVRIMPAGDPVRGWPAWWCFRAIGLREGQPLKVTVVGSTEKIPSGRPGGGKPLYAGWALPDRAALSTDREHWQQSPAGKREHGGITYSFNATGPEMWIAWGPMATPEITDQWLQTAAETHSFVEAFDLAKTHEGRFVRGIRIASGDIPVEGRPVVWLQARQHAWESGSSWVTRGVIDWLLGDAEDAVWLRHNALTFIVPIMDVDRTATGDGGKESTPQDHNRDWSKTPYYPEVAAVQDRIRSWSSQQRMGIFVDFHNPGPGNRAAYFYVAPDQVMTPFRTQRQNRLLDVIQSAWEAPIPLDRKTQSTGPNYHPLWRQMSATWVTEHGDDRTVAVCLESPWNTAHSTPEGYGEIGASMGAGISQFLQSDRTDPNLPK